MYGLQSYIVLEGYSFNTFNILEADDIFVNVGLNIVEYGYSCFRFLTGVCVFQTNVETLASGMIWRTGFLDRFVEVALVCSII
jgi:hypothetical protein